MKKHGFTLVEVCVAFAILTLLAGGIYKIMSDARNKRAIGEARSTIQGEVGRVLSQLKLDLNQAVGGTIKTNGTITGFVIELKLPEISGKPDGRVVKYEYASPYLNRAEDGKNHCLSRNMSEMSIVPFEKDGVTATGQYVVHAKGSLAIEGLKIPETHTQNQFIVAKEDVTSTFDPAWRPVRVPGILDGHADVLGALLDDMRALVDVGHAEIEGLVNDARNQVGEELEKAKQKLTGGLEKIRENIGKVNDSLRSMTWRVFLEAGFLDYNTDNRINCGYAIRDALVNMNSSRDMKWETLLRIAQDRGFENAFLNDDVRKLFDAKAKIFEAGKNLVDQMENLNMVVPPDLLGIFKI